MQYRRIARGFTPESIEDMRHRYEETDEPQEAIAADYNIHRATLDRLAKREGWKLRKDRPPRCLPRDIAVSRKADRALREAVGMAETAKSVLDTTASLPTEAVPHPSPPPATPTPNPSPQPPRDVTVAGAPAGGGEPAAASGEGTESRDVNSRIAVGDHSARLSRAEELEREIEEQLADVKRLRALGPLPIDAERTARTLERLTDTLFKVQRLRAIETGATAPVDDFDDIPEDIDEFRHALARRIEAFIETWSDGSVPDEGEASV
jgi:hypothetical protein